MTLRQKTLLLIGLTLIGLLGVLYATLSYLLMSHLYTLEKQKTQQEMKRAVNALSEDVAQLSVLSRQLGAWDDTYNFIKNSNDKRFVETNFSEETLTDFKINFILLLDTSGRIVFRRAFDLSKQKQTSIPPELLKHLKINSLLLQHPDLTSNRSGILLLPEAPLLIASQPIITNDIKGPVRGTLILGRYLNDRELERIEALNQLSLTVQRIKDTQLPRDFQSVYSVLNNPEQKQPNTESNKLLSNEEIIVLPLSDREIAGYALLKDIYGEPALLLRINIFRIIYQEARSNLRLLISSVFGVGVIFCIGTLLLIERLVLVRLASLSYDVKNIGTSGDLSMRVRQGGNDELSGLGNTINWMLGALESTLKQLKNEQEKAEHLLLNILPQPIAERLKKEEVTIADSFAEVTVLFADIVGFTKLASETSPVELVKLLNQIFSAFDRLAEQHGLEKIKTIGDAYMVVGGLPIQREDHAKCVANFALDMQQAILQFSKTTNFDFSMRIGIHSGPVVAGVIGLKKFIYDLWGDTVNIASRMESHGIPGQIQVTCATYEHLKDEFEFQKRGTISIKGRGEMMTYLLIGKKSSSQFQELPTLPL